MRPSPLANGQNRAGRHGDDAVGNASEKKPRQACSTTAMCAHHDQVNALRLRGADDLVGGRAFEEKARRPDAAPLGPW